MLYLETALEEALGFCLGECNVKQLSVLLYTEVQHLLQPPPERKKNNEKTINPAKVNHSLSPFDILLYLYCLKCFLNISRLIFLLSHNLTFQIEYNHILENFMNQRVQALRRTKLHGIRHSAENKSRKERPSMNEWHK